MYVAAPLSFSGSVEAPLERKLQWVRGFNAIVVGPVMIVGGYSLWQKNQKVLGGILVGLGGILTLINAYQWVRVGRALSNSLETHFLPTQITPDLQATDFSEKALSA